MYPDSVTEPEPQGLPLGWSYEDSRCPTIGFQTTPAPSTPRQRTLIEHRGEGHLISFGGTGRGKTRSCAIPALLSHKGPAVVLDVKGELYQVTAGYRRRMGQSVYRLDPWGIVDEDTDALNPLDLMTLPDTDPEEEAHTLAQLIAGPDSFERDKFWENTSLALNSGILAHLASQGEEQRRLSAARELMANDFETSVRTLLESGSVRSKLARDEFGIFLQHPAGTTRPSVLSTAQQHFRLYGTRSIRRATDQSTLSLLELTDDTAYTLYILVPPHRLHSHSSLLRTWLGTLLQTMSRRRRHSAARTLFLIDEAASLGPMEPLKSAITLLRGYGAQVWTFWQDASQIVSHYPNDWATIVNNADVVQILRPSNKRQADENAALLGGVTGEELLAMSWDDQALLTATLAGTRVCRKLDYLNDSIFAGRFEPNPMYLKPER